MAVKIPIENNNMKCTYIMPSLLELSTYRCRPKKPSE
jgi:hypothetical protein